MARNALTKLARTRPYSARQRILTVVRTHEGDVFASRHDLGISKNALWRLIRALGLNAEMQEIRLEFREVRAARQRAIDLGRWKANGELTRKRQREERRAAGLVRVRGTRSNRLREDAEDRKLLGLPAIPTGGKKKTTKKKTVKRGGSRRG